MTHRVTWIRSDFDIPRVRHKGGATVLSVEDNPRCVAQLPNHQRRYCYPSDVRVASSFLLTGDPTEVADRSVGAILDMQADMGNLVEEMSTTFERNFRHPPEALLALVGNKGEMSFQVGMEGIDATISTVFAVAALENASAYESMMTASFPFESTADVDVSEFPLDLFEDGFTLDRAVPLVTWVLSATHTALWDTNKAGKSGVIEKVASAGQG